MTKKMHKSKLGHLLILCQGQREYEWMSGVMSPKVSLRIFCDSLPQSGSDEEIPISMPLLSRWFRVQGRRARRKHVPAVLAARIPWANILFFAGTCSAGYEHSHHPPQPAYPGCAAGQPIQECSPRPHGVATAQFHDSAR